MKKAIVFMLLICLVFSKDTVVTAKYVDLGDDVYLVQSVVDLQRYLALCRKQGSLLYLDGVINLKNERMLHIPNGVTLFISRNSKLILADIPFYHDGVIYVAGCLDLRKMSEPVDGDGKIETEGLGGKILYNPLTQLTSTPTPMATPSPTLTPEPTATPSPTMIPEAVTDPVSEQETPVSQEDEAVEIITIRKMDSQASYYYLSNHSFLKTIPKIKKIQKKKRHIRITWKKISKASGYEIQIKKGKKRCQSHTGKRSYAFSLQKLKTKKIQIRVRAYKGKKKRTYTKWSSWKKYKVGS